MESHVAVAGQMKECREKTELYRPGKDLCLADLDEPMINLQQRNQMRPRHTEIVQALLGEETPRSGACVVCYWASVEKATYGFTVRRASYTIFEREKLIAQGVAI